MVKNLGKNVRQPVTFPSLCLTKNVETANVRKAHDVTVYLPGRDDDHDVMKCLELQWKSEIVTSNRT